MDWLKKAPIVSLLLVVAIAAVPFMLDDDPESATAAFRSAQAEARKYIAENPRLEVDRLGELTLGAEWLSELRETQSLSGNEGDIELPSRMLARSQARLDTLIDVASAERMKAEPSLRLGVLDRQSPPANLFAHAFVHENAIGAFLAIAMIFLAGIALERCWGSLVFGLFSIVAIPAIAQLYLALDASNGIPWSGASGLVAALLGAYCIRGLGGLFTVPGWVVVPCWLGLDVFAVRGLSFDQLSAMPWATVFAGFGFGALVAGVLKLANLESQFAVPDSQKNNETNPIVTRAARLSSDGDPYQAFDLLQAAWRDNPADDQVAEAFYSNAVEIDQPEAAAEAILPIVRDCLRAGRVDAAVERWLPLASRSCDVRIEATAAVRLGEALLDGGNPEEALFSLQLALDNGASAAHATRIVNVARDLDADLARRAAQAALADPSLDPASKQGLEAIAYVNNEGLDEDEERTVPTRLPGNGDPAAAPESTPVSKSQLDRRVSAEHHVVETTAFPLGEDLDLTGAECESGLFSTALDDAASDDLEVGDSSDLGGDLFSSTESLDFSGEDSGDVLSHWNDPGAIDASDLDGELTKLNDELADETLFEEGGLEAPGDGEDFSDLSVADSGEFADTDQTPLVDSTDELTSPMLRDLPASADLSSEAGTATDPDDVLDDQTVLFEAPPTDNAAVSSLLTMPGAAAPSALEFGHSEPALASAAPTASATPANLEDLGGTGSDDATTLIPLRELRVIDAIPVEVTGHMIEIDADGHGKSKLPMSRIQAVAVAAVSGIVSRPVLIVDCVLNWNDDIGSPMKLIRFRSDRFDPLQFAPGEKDALSALLCWVGELQCFSSASALPSRAALAGEFAHFESLEGYEREVLLARRADDA